MMRSKRDKMTTRENMSQPQKNICDYIAAFTKERRYPPSIREICEGLGYKSPSTVAFHLNRLEELGVIIKGDRYKNRCIRLVNEHRITVNPSDDDDNTTCCVCNVKNETSGIMELNFGLTRVYVCRNCLGAFIYESQKALL